MSSPRRLVIDTDAGQDDAQAILMALADPGVDVVAITTVHGNTGNDQVAKNVLRLLKVAGRMDVSFNFRLCYLLHFCFLVLGTMQSEHSHLNSALWKHWK